MPEPLCAGCSLMDSPTYIITWNTNRIQLDAWVDKCKRADGDYDQIGMGRRTEFDAATGAMVSDKVEPTGLTGWAPREAIEGPRVTLWGRIKAML